MDTIKQALRDNQLAMRRNPKLIGRSVWITAALFIVTVLLLGLAAFFNSTAWITAAGLSIGFFTVCFSITAIFIAKENTKKPEEQGGEVA